MITEQPPSPAPKDAPISRSITRQKSHVFISYSRSDRLAVDRLFDDLNSAQYSLWMDVTEFGIEAGEDWQHELEREMSAADSVIACLSPDFLNSPFCRAEIEQARSEKKPIFPVVVRRLNADTDLKGTGLEHLQYIDLTYGEQAYTLGVKRLRTVLPRPRYALRHFALKLLRAAAAVLGLLAVFALGMLFMWRLVIAFLPPPSLADKDIGVAVAQFSTPTDGSVSAADADLLSRRFSNLLRQELTASFAPLRLTLGFLGPEVVGEVSANPENTAGEFTASVVVYGEIVRNARGQLEITPRFYVDPRAFADIAEITGTSRLGSAIRIASLSDPIPVQQALSSRTTALTHVIIGLSQYISRDYVGALDSFTEAINEPGLDVEQGGQAVRVLIGSTHLKLASLDTQRGDNEAAIEQLEQATAEYEAVKTETPEYARAYTGLAAATFLRWNLLSQETGEPASVDLLEQALAYLDEADLREQPHFVFQIRALYARMQIEYHLWAYYPADTFESERHDELLTDFRRLANRIITNYDGGNNPALRDIAAEAHAYLGLAFYGLNDCTSAIPEFESATSTSIENERIMTFSGWLGDCFAETGQTESAIQAYTRARDLAQATEGINQSIIDQYQTKLDALQARG